MTVRATATWTANGEKITCEVATDATYSPDVAQDLEHRAVAGLREVVDARRGTDVVP